MLDVNYVLGLVDGEGSFTVYVRNPSSKTKTKRKVVVEPRFYIKLNEDDKDILYQLKDFFSCGSIYYQRDKRKNHKNCYRYEVFNRKELNEVIIPFFTKHNLKFKTKINDFNLFCDLMSKINNGNHLNEKGLEEIYKIKQKMH